jgi:two-component system NarL family response regulator
MIRIMLVDDHNLVREALRTVLEQEGMQVVAEAAAGEAALKLADECEIDLVVMDIALPNASGIETTRRLLEKHPRVKVLALSTYLDRRTVQQTLDAGASGYIVKSAAGIELKQGIRAVMEGRSYLSTEVATLIADAMRGIRPQPESGSEKPLTPREIEVVHLLVDGKTSVEIAMELHISPNTVEVHRRNILRKLKMKNSVELTRHVLQTGIVSV